MTAALVSGAIVVLTGLPAVALAARADSTDVAYRRAYAVNIAVFAILAAASYVGVKGSSLGLARESGLAAYVLYGSLAGEWLVSLAVYVSYRIGRRRDAPHGASARDSLASSPCEDKSSRR